MMRDMVVEIQVMEIRVPVLIRARGLGENVPIK